MKFRALLLGLSLWLTANTFAQENKSIFWTSPQGVFQASLADLEICELAPVTMLTANYFEIDPRNQKLYWTDQFLGKVVRSDLDGSNVEDVVTQGQGTPLGLSLDVDAGKMYWVDDELFRIARSNLDGSEIETITRVRATSIAVDPGNEKLYWIGEGQGPFVRRSNLDGSEVEDILTGSDGITSPTQWVDIKLDLTANKVYVAALNHIYRANLDGSLFEELIDRSGGARGFSIDESRGKMYWIANNLGQIEIRQANLGYRTWSGSRFRGDHLCRRSSLLSLREPCHGSIQGQPGEAGTERFLSDWIEQWKELGPPCDSPGQALSPGSGRVALLPHQELVPV